VVARKEEGIKASWLPRIAQALPTGFTDTAIEEAVEDPEEKQATVGDPIYMGRNLGRLALINQLMESPQVKAVATNIPQMAPSLDKIGADMRAEIDRTAYAMVQRMGDPAAFEPHLVNNFFIQLAELYDDEIVGEMQEQTIRTINDVAVQADVKNTFQELFNVAMSEQVKGRTLPTTAPAFFASSSWRIRTAQAPGTQADVVQETPPTDVVPGQYPPGVLLTPKYQGYDHLEKDLVELGPERAYKQIFEQIQDQDSAKGALAAFFQGSPAGLATLYSLLVQENKAEPIDKELVEKIMEKHPELSEKSACKQCKGCQGLWLPPDAKMEKQASGGVGGANQAYHTHGPWEKRFCPKLRNITNTFVCRYHCLDGLAIDDNEILCGEAIWRQAIMDKYSREYRDADGNWVGGYINKRFEVVRDTGGHPYQLKPGQRRSPIHEDAWSTEKRLQEMRRDEAANRGYSETTGDPKGLYNWDPHEQHGTTKNPQFAEKPKDPIAKIAQNETKEAKKGVPVNPWAVCTETVGREDKEKYEECVLKVKSKHPIKKEESSWLPKAEQPKQEKQAEVSESDSMWDEPRTSSADPDSWNPCTVTAEADTRQTTSSWKMEKDAFPSPVDAPADVGPAGTECEKCRMTGPAGAKVCPNPGCGGKMRTMPKQEFWQKTKTIPKEDAGMMPSMGSSGGNARFSHGVFRYVAADGTVGYGDTIREAQARTDLSELQPRSLEEEASEVSYFMQEPPGQVSVPQAQPVATPQALPPQAEIQGGVSELGEPKAEEQHTSGGELDLAYSQELFQNDPEEQEEYEEQQDRIVLGPDPSTK
jgi:hypothetical protein